MLRMLGIVAVATALALTGCGDDDASDEGTTTDEEEPSDDDDEGGGDAGAPLCEIVPDAVVSEALGLELSSAETSFNDENACNYETSDRAFQLFLGRTDDLGQGEDFFIETGEANVEDFEEIDGIGDAAYFGLSGNNALAAALGDGLVTTANLSLPGDEDIADYRDGLVELLTLLVDAA